MVYLLKPPCVPLCVPASTQYQHRFYLLSARPLNIETHAAALFCHFLTALNFVLADCPFCNTVNPSLPRRPFSTASPYLVERDGDSSTPRGFVFTPAKIRRKSQALSGKLLHVSVYLLPYLYFRYPGQISHLSPFPSSTLSFFLQRLTPIHLLLSWDHQSPTAFLKKKVPSTRAYFVKPPAIYREISSWRRSSFLSVDLLKTRSPSQLPVRVNDSSPR